MQYTINKLAKLAGVSTRTLRWYDECGLLKPHRISSNGYRVYGQAEIDRLQHILFYCELGVELSEIGRILEANSFDGLAALQSHLEALRVKRKQLDSLISTVEKSILAKKGETVMSSEEKFEGFKKKLIKDNEQKYGDEIREKYGDESVDSSNAKVRGMTEAQFGKTERLSQEVNDTLRAAFEQGDPSSTLAQKACALHKDWLCYYWDTYSKEEHLGVTQMYVDDPRFTEYYDNVAPGCAVFLRDAVQLYCAEV